jgi:hypothetical protein
VHLPFVRSNKHPFLMINVSSLVLGVSCRGGMFYLMGGFTYCDVVGVCHGPILLLAVVKQIA